MAKFVPESAIDYEAVFQRGGRNCGDEDFALFKCPNCGYVFLLEYEVDTVYLDGGDLAKRAPAYDQEVKIPCTKCSQPLPHGIWIGPNAEDRFKVTWDDLKTSTWFWVATPSRAFGADD